MGISYDIHSIKPGDRGMYLGGVKVSDTFYLAGHSDGDALSCDCRCDSWEHFFGNIISFPEDEKTEIEEV